MNIYHFYNQGQEAIKIICLCKVSKKFRKAVHAQVLPTIISSWQKPGALWALHFALFCHFSAESEHTSYLEFGCLVPGTSARVCGVWSGACSDPVVVPLDPCPPSPHKPRPWPPSSPPEKHGTNTSLCLSSSPPKRAMSLFICNFQLTRHQAPAQRLSKCSKEGKKIQPNSSRRTLPFN